MNARPTSHLRSSLATTAAALCGRGFGHPSRRRQRGFTMLEMLLSLALVSMVMVAMNTFIFSMGELWGKNTDELLFDRHVRAVTRFLDHTLREASLPPSAAANSTPMGIEEVRPQNGAMDKLLTFELLAGNRLFEWPDRPLPEVICSLQVRQNDGLYLGLSAG
jgi:prepilin-type N-terminal cleavage/methylation domain-containing protein